MIVVGVPNWLTPSPHFPKTVRLPTLSAWQREQLTCAQKNLGDDGNSCNAQNSVRGGQ
ncbi:hypothetical protein BLL52_1489 [Rhodoferax antarcticus ANT.BR]|uniref:Uncharacterized protein n=1 Tax=Rhodoferax antarcticus ANT.BR TaxID=1111071 RepID=A0A1Q8YGS2_9BURK|nr:hypothetical protein BLL52_1489 [Rhodoferax antarcticus ANT.BR]